MPDLRGELYKQTEQYFDDNGYEVVTKNVELDFSRYVAIENYYNGAAETIGFIEASPDARCRYMKLQCVIELLSEDEIKITKSFGHSEPRKEAPSGKRILFTVISEDKQIYYFLYFNEVYHLTAIDPSLHETLPQHLT